MQERYVGQKDIDRTGNVVFSVNLPLEEGRAFKALIIRKGTRANRILRQMVLNELEDEGLWPPGE